MCTRSAIYNMQGHARTGTTAATSLLLQQESRAWRRREGGPLDAELVVPAVTFSLFAASVTVNRALNADAVCAEQALRLHPQKQNPTSVNTSDCFPCQSNPSVIGWNSFHTVTQTVDVVWVRPLARTH